MQTKNGIAAYLRLIHNLSSQAVKLANDLFYALPQTEAADAIIDDLARLDGGEVSDIDEFVQRFFSDYIPEDTPEGEPLHPATVIADGPENVEIRISTGKGGYLIPYTFGCDFGTVAAGVSYMEATSKSEIDLCLTEVKKGDLARNNDPENEDIDYYIYNDPFDTDFKLNGTIRYKDIKTALSVEE